MKEDELVFPKKYKIHMNEEIIVYKLEGWEKSTGVLAEIEFCKQNNIKVIYK